MSKQKLTALFVLFVTLGSCAIAASIFMRLWEPDLIIQGPGVTKVGKISDYFNGIKDKDEDTAVYYLDSGKPGATILITAGVHPDETASFMTAVTLIENAVVKQGRLIIIPQANASSYTHNYSQEAYPQFLHYTTKDGSVRKFRGGSRQVNPIHHWPDPEIFNHYPTGQQLAGEEVRNLNRAFPGRADGTFAERIAHAITTLVKTEKVDMNIDLHEAVPEYPFINAMGVHERAQEIATIAAMDMQFDDVAISLEMSPPKFRGLSYRELGDHTPSIAVLSETPNPSLGRIRGVTDETLVIEGKDAFYVQADKIGRTFVPYSEAGWPLNLRIARNYSMIQALLRAFVELNPEKSIELDNVLSYAEMKDTPVGTLLNPLSKAGK